MVCVCTHIPADPRGNSDSLSVSMSLLVENWRTAWYTVIL